MLGIKFINSISWLFIFAGVIEGIWGMGQIYGVISSNHDWYVQTGSFYNPGPYSGFLAMCLPVCLYKYLQTKEKQKSIFKQIALCATVLIVCMLPSGLSRSAWVSAAFSSLYIVLMHYYPGLKEFAKKHYWQVRVGIVITIVLLVTILIATYYMKKDSADGRFLIWNVATHAIMEQPLKGYGWNNVAGVYGEMQEKYFASQDTFTEQEAFVAGAPEYVFNEYLQVAIAWGIPMLLVILLLTAICFYGTFKQNEYGLGGALISLAIFSLASYPFQFMEFILAYTLLLFSGLICITKCFRKTVWYIPVFIGFILIGVCWYIGQEKYERRLVEKEWNNWREFYRDGDYVSAAEYYSKYFHDMLWNGSYLFEFGHALHMANRYEESNKILKNALKVSSEPMILNIIGRNYQALGDYKMAEAYYLRSCYRLPNRIYPYYLLAKLYSDSTVFPHDKLEWAVNMVLEKKPKVLSTAIQQMKEDVKNMMECKSNN